MKKLLAGLALLGFTAGISAETVVNYDDGSTYTLADGEEIFISKDTLFKRRIMNNKDTCTTRDTITSINISTTITNIIIKIIILL